LRSPQGLANPNALFLNGDLNFNDFSCFLAYKNIELAEISCIELFGL